MRGYLTVVSWAVWVAFAADLTIRLALADDRRRYALHHWYDLALVAVGLGALAVLDAERDAPDANITTIGDALWWANTTVTTVGYGDRFPVTTEGRLVAAVLMVLGISVVGAVTASVASWILAHAATERTEQRPDV